MRTFVATGWCVWSVKDSDIADQLFNSQQAAIEYLKTRVPGTYKIRRYTIYVDL